MLSTSGSTPVAWGPGGLIFIATEILNLLTYVPKPCF